MELNKYDNKKKELEKNQEISSRQKLKSDIV